MKGIAELEREEEGRGTRPSFGNIKLDVCYRFTGFQGSEKSSRKVPVELSHSKVVWPKEEMRAGNWGAPLSVSLGCCLAFLIEKGVIGLT